MLPYFLGCPSWNEPAWRGSFYPADVRPADTLEHYARVFNAVEGNTTFYARPSVATLQLWAERMPGHFRFCAKLPRDISHEGDLRDRIGATGEFLRLLEPLGTRVAPLWLQLPASFGPQRLGELADWLDTFSHRAIAVEVRNAAFFARGEEEKALNRLLHARGVERICLDSRALFACESDDPAVLHAQSKKPRVPVRPTAFSASPGALHRWSGPRRQPALPRPLAGQGGRLDRRGPGAPCLPAHPDNHLAAAQAQRFHAGLMSRLPACRPWPRAPSRRNRRNSTCSDAVTFP